MGAWRVFQSSQDLYHYIVRGPGRVLKVSFTFTSLVPANGRLQIRLCIKKVSFLWFGSGEKAKRGKKWAEGAGHPTGGVPTA